MTEREIEEANAKGEELQKTVQKCVDGLKKLYGDESAVILIVGIPEGKEHNHKRWAWSGRCLMVEGLLHRAANEILGTMWNQSPSK